MIMPCVYVFDIDGVLIDVNSRLRIAMEKSGGRNRVFWAIFFSEELFELDRPRNIGIQLLREKAEKGEIYIISGRPKRLYNITLDQLRDLGVLRYVKSIFLRKNNDLRPSHVYKLEVLSNLINKGVNVCEIHDDDEKLIKEVKKLYPGINAYLHVGNEVLFYKGSKKLNYWFKT